MINKFKILITVSFNCLMKLGNPLQSLKGCLKGGVVYIILKS